MRFTSDTTEYFRLGNRTGRIGIVAGRILGNVDMKFIFPFIHALTVLDDLSRHLDS